MQISLFRCRCKCHTIVHCNDDVRFSAESFSYAFFFRLTALFFKSKLL